jgi:4-amino-4-deoxy-L-arabinose transferase-like glycosyltransferase
VRGLVRSHLRFFLLAALSGLALRLFFVLYFSKITTDSFIYGDIAKNWLQYGTYGISDGTKTVPTYIRLPGYPAFLAAVFAIFGMEHYRAVLLMQIFVDLATCFLIADTARRLISERAAKAAFLLAALCPFLANYAATPLTETLEVFFTTLALDCGLAGLQRLEAGKFGPWFACGLAIGCAILLRPDGGILLIAVLGYLLVLLVKSFSRNKYLATHLLRASLTVLIVSLAPLIPWTLRNLHTLHRFQPLAPRYANEENEVVPMGFNRWMKTWIADYVSTEEIYWAVPGSELDVQQLPSRAFDSDQQREQTEQLLNDYNAVLHVTPELDARFASLAKQRIAQAPLRYYFWSPLVRIADMWLRPRTELLPSDTRWWEFDDDPKWSALAVAVGIINLLYIGIALLALVRKWPSSYLWLPLGFVVLRSAFLGTLENPEPRYTLECYPIVILLCCVALVPVTNPSQTITSR